VVQNNENYGYVHSAALLLDENKKEAMKTASFAIIPIGILFF
jgi:hypothetical protein